MRCPGDGRELTPVEYEGALIHTCETCGGELLSGDSLGHIVRTRQAHFGPQWDGLMKASRPLAGVPAKNLQRGVACPVCAAKMQTVNYLGDASLMLDRCLACGSVWLDSSELEQVQIMVEKWQDRAPDQLRSISLQLENARRNACAAGEAAFQGSRFAFANALINRLLDAA